MNSHLDNNPYSIDNEYSTYVQGKYDVIRPRRPFEMPNWSRKEDELLQRLSALGLTCSDILDVEHLVEIIEGLYEGDAKTVRNLREAAQTLQNQCTQYAQECTKYTLQTSALEMKVEQLKDMIRTYSDHALECEVFESLNTGRVAICDCTCGFSKKKEELGVI